MEQGDSDGKKCLNPFSIENLIRPQCVTGLSSPEARCADVVRGDADATRVDGYPTPPPARPFPSIDLAVQGVLSSRGDNTPTKSPPRPRASPVRPHTSDNKENSGTSNRGAAQDSSPTSSTTSGSPDGDIMTSRKKKARTAFSTEQLMELERRFRQHKYLGTDERAKLALDLGLSDQQVKTWFQNRRMKEKRQIREMEQLQTIPAAHASPLAPLDPLRYPLGYPSATTTGLPGGFSLFPPSMPGVRSAPAAPVGSPYASGLISSPGSPYPYARSGFGAFSGMDTAFSMYQYASRQALLHQ